MSGRDPRHRDRAGSRPRLRSGAVPAVATILVTALAIALGWLHLGGSGDVAWSSTTVLDQRISELTGVTRSTYARDLMWTIGGPEDGAAILGVDAGGRTAVHLTVSGAYNHDWQDIAAGPEHTLWVADVSRVRKRATILTVYRITEPADLAQTTVDATAYRLRLPVTTSIGQSLLVHPWTGRLYVATERSKRGGLWVAPARLTTEHRNELTRVARIPGGVSGGTFATRGPRMVLVDDDTSYLYAAPGAEPRTQPLPDAASPTGVSLDRRDRALLISSAEDRAIYTVPLGPGSWPSVPEVSLPTVPTSSALPTSGPSPSATGSRPPTGSASPTTGPTGGPTSPDAPDPASSGPLGVGMYGGSFSYESFRSDFGGYPDVETTYLNADQVTTPNLARHEAEIDRGISPVITLGYKNGPFTRAEIAAWGPQVQRYFEGFVAGLKTLADYAAKADNGTRVYFADEHEAQIKINQDKYAYSGYGASQAPTTAQSAAAWNKVMDYVRSAAPKVVRTYWYGGSGANEDAYASLLEPSLIQMATFDPYRWRHNSASETPQQLWGSRIAALKSKSWMRNADGSLKPWGLTEWGTDAALGDAANATFVTQTFAYLREQGAAFAVYFNRVDGNDRTNDFVITDGSQPRTLAAFRDAMR